MINLEAILEDFKTFLAGIEPPVLMQKAPSMIITVIIIFVAFNLLYLVLSKLLKNTISEGRRQILKKALRYTGFVLAIFYILNHSGINIAPILGAAGIAGVVIGFAAQTAVSSIISGFFLISEKAFAVGDVIKVDNILGVVLSVDSLSVKLRTFDNLFVRIPNETIIKSNLTTITRFPIRRLDITFSVSYREDLEKLRDILFRIAAENPYSLETPEPLFIIDKFSDSGFVILFALWFESCNFLNLKTSVSIDIKKRFDAEGIELPHRKIDVTVESASKE